MTSCPSCSAPNRDEARFCSACGSGIASAPAGGAMHRILPVLIVLGVTLWVYAVVGGINGLKTLVGLDPFGKKVDIVIEDCGGGGTGATGSIINHNGETVSVFVVIGFYDGDTKIHESNDSTNVRPEGKAKFMTNSAPDEAISDCKVDDLRVLPLD